MSEFAKRLPPCLDISESSVGADEFIFLLENLLPSEAEVMWISPAGESEQIIAVCLGHNIIYFSGADMPGANFLNWHDYFSLDVLTQCLKENLKIDQAQGVVQLKNYVRQAIRSVGMQSVFVVEAVKDEVIIKHAKDDSFFASCSEEILPKTYKQVQRYIEELLEIEEPESADSYDTFLTLFESVNANEFQNAFTFQAFPDSAVEVTFKNGKKKRQDKSTRVWIDKSFWGGGLNRAHLVDFLTDSLSERLDDKNLEFTLFIEVFRTLVSEYPDLKYKIGLKNARFVSADRTECYFTGIRSKMDKSIKPLAQKFCADLGYRANEMDCTKFTTESALRSFFEYDLGYASPKELRPFEKRSEK